MVAYIHRPHWYRLDGHTPVPCSMIECRIGGKAHVAKTYVGTVFVSTVFLGVDHAWSGRPMLFETMIFGGKHDEECWRYSTWQEAEDGHWRAVKLVKDETFVRRIQLLWMLNCLKHLHIIRN